MSRTYLLSAIFVAFATSAFAADFFIVQDLSTKRCSVVSANTTASTKVIVGGGTYRTRGEAEAALKTACIEPREPWTPCPKPPC
jgi:hypothetical protein